MSRKLWADVFFTEISLAGVSRTFYEHRINVRTIHIMHRIRGHAIVAVTTDDDETARTLLDRDSLI